MAHPDTFGALVRHYRRRSGLTQEELAERAELSPRGLIYLERGERRPQPGTVRRLADALELTDSDRSSFLSAGEFPSRSVFQGVAHDPGDGVTIQLPPQPTPFVGRVQELEAISSVLGQEDVRLLTLCGPGGAGKTRLALRVAEEMGPRFPDGIYFVGLAALQDANLVAATIAGELGVSDAGGASARESLEAHVSTRVLLLILDNFEHLLDARSLVSRLLAVAPGLKVLVTSRTVLHVAAEREYQVPPLSLPDPANLPAVDALLEFDAVDLFVGRAKSVRPDFTLSAENAPDIARICHVLDGLPLAIELAAARIKLFPPRALLGRLSRRLELLTGGPDDLPGRQRTLRATLDWSFDLLDDDQRLLFARLAVFAGDWSLEAAETICHGDPLHIGVVSGIDSLLDQSLVRRSGADEPRLALLDTVREYAADRLAARYDDGFVRRRHAQYFADLVVGADTAWFGPDHGVWLRRLEQEHENVRSAISWTIEQREADLAACLVGCMWRFWESRGYLNEGRRWLEITSDLSLEADPGPHSRTLEGAGWLAVLQGENKRAAIALDQSLHLAVAAGDERRVASILCTQGAAAQVQGSYPEASSLYERSIVAYRNAGDPGGAARPRHNVATIAYAQGDLGRAQAMFQENIIEMKRLQNPRILAGSLEGLALTLLSQARYDEAGALLEESLAVARSLEDNRQIASSLHNLGDVRMHRHDYARARAFFEEALELSRDMGDRFRVTACLESLGILAWEQGELEQAETALLQCLAEARADGYRDFVPGLIETLAKVSGRAGRTHRATTLFGAADALRGQFGMQMTAEEADEHDREVARIHTELSITDYHTAYERGCALTEDEIVAYAIETASPMTV